MLTDIQNRKMMYAYRVKYQGMKSRIIIRELIPIIGFFRKFPSNKILNYQIMIPIKVYMVAVPILNMLIFAIGSYYYSGLITKGHHHYAHLNGKQHNLWFSVILMPIKWKLSKGFPFCVAMERHWSSSRDSQLWQTPRFKTYFRSSPKVFQKWILPTPKPNHWV